jgi:hypothetical protein
VAGGYQRALVGERHALHWEYKDKHLVLRTADGLAELRVPVEDLASGARMDGHFARMASLLTVEQADELDEIAEGAR